MTTDLGSQSRARRNGVNDVSRRHRPFDEGAVQRAVQDLIRALGEDPDREGLRDTPRRISQMYAEILAGLDVDPAEFLSVQFGNGYDEMVILRDIPFYSMCEHHFLPFHGVAHVGYIPDGRVVGISKIARVVEAFAKRPQLQERLTAQVADCIMRAVKPDGVAVVVEAEHLCMTMRGVRKPGSRMVTSAMRGGFRKQSVTRAEFLSLVQGG
ncbi:MAG TPA: GTP cyclohydrolase I FolE [Dehalococcoidia bacterium]|nr:GTP cyclohydrolase I FolE [Dehalococcoidia bacterium]